MHASRGRISRAAALLVAVAVAFGTVAVPPGASAATQAPAAVAAACASDVALQVYETVVYDSVIGILIDGIILNDSGTTIDCVRVKAAWPSGQTAEGWPAGELEPGEWTAFHIEWPDGLPTSAGLPVVTASGSPGTFTHYDLDYTPPVLVSEPGAGYRTWVTTVTNPEANGVPVSSIEIAGYEQDDESALVDCVMAWLPCEDGLAPGESAEVEFHAKNMSATSTVSVTALRITGKEQPVVTLSYDTLTPAIGQAIQLRVDLKTFDGVPITGSRTLKVYYSTDGGKNWSHKYCTTETGFAVIPLAIDKPTLLKAWFWGDSEYGAAGGGIVAATPRNATMLLAAPSAVRVNRQFKVRGVLKRGGTTGNGRTVTVQAYKRVGSRWALKTSYRAYPTASGSYVRSMSLRSRGQWKLRAYRAGVGYTPYRYVRVK